MVRQLSFDDYLSISNHISSLHCDSKGWITVANKEISDELDEQGESKAYWYQRHYHVDDLINNPQLIEQIKEYDCYVSQNTFYTTYRRLETIKELRALYIDIDVYKTGFSKSQALLAIEYMVKDNVIPQPNLIIDSGRGLYCVWCIHSVPYMALPLWNAVQRYLYEKFCEYGADHAALDAQRVLRIAGTYNSESKTQVKIIDTYPIKHHLRDIQKEYMPELKKRSQRTQTHKEKNITAIYNTYSLNFARLNDLLMLLKIRNYDMHTYKRREITLFLYRYWTCCFTQDPGKALEDALELNQKFIYPLSINEVRSATRSAEIGYLKKDKAYNYSNTTLIELLYITPEEQMHLKTIISKDEKYRRNNERRTPRNKDGLTPRQQLTKQTGEKIRALIRQGKNVTEVSSEIGISRTMLYRTYKDYLKKTDRRIDTIGSNNLKSKKYDTWESRQGEGRNRGYAPII